MKLTHPQFGLVLAGGGAKGAYQAGALKYLAELGFQPQIIAGTSIGALNGAVLASHQSFSKAVARLNELWEQLGKEEILHLNLGLELKTISYATKTSFPKMSNLSQQLREQLIKLGVVSNNNSIFNPAPIEKRLREAVNLTELRRGIELWITVYPALAIPGVNVEAIANAVNFIRARSGGETKACWLCAQDFENDETLYNLLLASAAFPVAFPQREVNGQFYLDGALGDNIPLGALAARGCTHAVIIHLGNGEIWNRYDFPQQAIIEIRPQQPINCSNTPIVGSLRSALNFSTKRIAELKQQGYDDAKVCLEPIIDTFFAVREQRQTHKFLTDFTKVLLEDFPFELD